MIFKSQAVLRENFWLTGNIHFYVSTLSEQRYTSSKSATAHWTLPGGVARFDTQTHSAGGCLMWTLISFPVIIISHSSGPKTWSVEKESYPTMAPLQRKWPKDQIIVIQFKLFGTLTLTRKNIIAMENHN